MQHADRSKTTEKRPPRAGSNVPTSGDEAPPTDGEDAGAVSHDDFFGTPALADEEKEDEDEFSLDFLGENVYGESPNNGPGDVWGDPKAEPPTIPSLPFSAYPPQKVLYKAAFRAAYKYPDALMLVMQGVRKGLKRGKKAAEQVGGQDR